MKDAPSSLSFSRRPEKIAGSLRTLLSGGDRRSIGKSNQVVGLLKTQPRAAVHLLRLMWDPDPLIAMRAADALEKLSRSNPVVLQPYKSQLLGLLAEATQPEIRWHLAAMIPRLRLTRAECHRAAEIFRKYLEDRSSIVKTFAMQALSDLAAQEPALCAEVTELVRTLARTGTPAMKARGRHLLKKLEG